MAPACDLLLALSTDGRAAYATPNATAFHIGDVKGGAAERIEVASVSDLAWCGPLLLVCCSDGTMKIRRDGAWVGTLRLSEDAGGVSVAAGQTKFGEAWYRSGGTLTRLRFDGTVPTADHFLLSSMPTALAPVDTDTLLAVGASPTVAELRATPPTKSLLKAAWGWLRPPEPKKAEDGVVDLSDGKKGTCALERTCFDDSRRKTTAVWVAPTRTLAAVADDKGRVAVVDLRSGRVVRLFKGVRDAQCAWLQIDDGEPALYLAILAPQRSQIRVWRCRFGGCAAAFTVALENASLVNAPTTPATAFLAALQGDSLVLEPLEPDLDRCRALADAERQRARLAGAQARCHALLMKADAGGDVDAARNATLQAFKEKAEVDVLHLCTRTFRSPECLIAVLEASEDERATALIPCERARASLRGDFGTTTAFSVDDPRLLEARAWLVEATSTESTHPLVERALDLLLKDMPAPGGLVDAIESEAGAALFFRGHRAFRATFYKTMVASTFRIGFRPLKMGKVEDRERAAKALARAASSFASELCAPLLSGDPAAVDVVDRACGLLDLDRGGRAKATALWFLRLDALKATQVLDSGAFQKWLRFYVIDHTGALRAAQLAPPSRAEAALHELAASVRDVVQPVIRLCRASTAQAQALALACSLTAAVRICATAAEDRCHGVFTADDRRWGLPSLDGEISTLRCAAVLAAGPSRQKTVTANALRDEAGALAYAVCEDAAVCSEETEVPAALGGDGVKLAELVRKRPERGWIHRAFPELDGDSLRCLQALTRAADSVDGGWALAASARDVRKSSESQNGAARCASAWCAAELWKTALAPKVAARLRGEDAPHNIGDASPDDGALFGAAVDVLEALALAALAVRPYAGPANVMVRGAADGFVSLAIPLEAVRDAYAVPAASRLVVLSALARSLVSGLSIEVDPAGVAELFGEIDLDLEHAASDAEVSAAESAERTLAVALSDPAAAAALRAKRAEQAGEQLADELATTFSFASAADPPVPPPADAAAGRRKAALQAFAEEAEVDVEEVFEDALDGGEESDDNW